MIISFDLDNTLIPYSDEFEVEDTTLLSRLFKAESIRKGTIQLFEELTSRGHTIWVYTTSFRSQFKMKKTFRAYGLNPSKFINEKINQRVLKKHQCSASKNARLFGIDVHIDDLEGVGMEGKKYGFETIILDTNDKDWSEKVLQGVEAIQLKNGNK